MEKCEYPKHPKILELQKTKYHNVFRVIWDALWATGAAAAAAAAAAVVGLAAHSWQRRRS